MRVKEVAKEFIREFKEQVKSIKTEGIKKQVPNILTLSRGLSPLVIIPVMLLNKIYAAIVLLIIFAITDFLDGKLARKYKVVSTFGIKLDTVCDKFFVLGIMIPAMIKYPFLGINLFMEACISYVNVISESKNNNPSSSMTGKIKTTFLSITLILSYIPNIDRLIVLGLAIATLILQIMAVIRYRKTDIEKDNKKK